MKTKVKKDLFVGDLFENLDDVSLKSKVISKPKLNKKNFDNSDRKIYQVSEINSLIKGILEKSFAEIWLEGEISNSKLHSSGHFYCSLKDAESQIKGVMFNHLYTYLKFEPKDGMKVIVKGNISCFAKAGSYQINIVYMEPHGIGSLQIAFEQLKEKLLNEGLFDKKYKKPLPMLPQKIGIITSPTGAAIRDILSVLDRRYSNVNVIIYPVRVQGEEAKFEIVEALDYFNSKNNFMDIDVILLGRGGGSIEDLWAFNEEIVARAIFASKIPIISCVGHEVDFVIADFVSDLRAPTPSAAAELVVVDKMEIKSKLDFLKNKLINKINHILDKNISKLDIIKSSKFIKNPIFYFDDYFQNLDYILEKMSNNMNRILDSKAYKIGLLKSKVEAADPDKIIEKGYAIIRSESGENIVRKDIKIEDRINVIFKDMKLLCKVLGKTNK